MTKIIKKIKRKVKGITSDELIRELVSGGATIGKGVYFFEASATCVDASRPWLLSIGEYTKITRGCVILTHDYSLSVLRRVYGEWIGEGKETVIGKNCFIGINSILLMGTKLGDNVIVGAGSVVRGTFPDNVVIAGNPAKVICTLDEHYANRRRKSIEEAKECARVFYRKTGRKPTMKDLESFKFLFMERDKELLEQNHLGFYCHGDEPAEVEKAFYDTKPYWNGFDAFLKEAFENE